MVYFKSLIRLITFFIYHHGLCSVVQRQENKRKNQRLLVQINSGIGDAILSLPLIHQLKKRGYEVHALTNPRTKSIAELCPDIDASYVLEYKLNRFIDEVRDILVLKRLKFSYFVGALPSNCIRDFFLPIFLKIPIRVKHISPRQEVYRKYDFLSTKCIPADRQKHNVESNLMLLPLLGERPGEERAHFHLALPRNLSDGVRTKLRKLAFSDQKIHIGIHPGCLKTRPFKRWSVHHFIEVMNSMSKNPDLQFCLFGGPDETELIDPILREARVQPVSLIGKLTLRETICAISFCRIFISNDSSLMHIATVFEIPVISLFGDGSNEKATGPYGAQNIILKRPAIGQISPEEVVGELKRLLESDKTGRVAQDFGLRGG